MTNILKKCCSVEKTPHVGSKSSPNVGGGGQIWSDVDCLIVPVINQPTITKKDKKAISPTEKLLQV